MHASKKHPARHPTPPRELQSLSPNAGLVSEIAAWIDDAAPNIRRTYHISRPFVCIVRRDHTQNRLKNGTVINPRETLQAKPPPVLLRPKTSLAPFNSRTLILRNRSIVRVIAINLCPNQASPNTGLHGLHGLHFPGILWPIALSSFIAIHESDGPQKAAVPKTCTTSHTRRQSISVDISFLSQPLH